MLKVLLVDDEPILVKGLRCLIEWEKYDFEICGAATSAIKALEMVEELKPDLIITDLVMPEMDGIEFIQRLLLVHKNCKVVILSGHGEFQYAKKALEYSVSDYLLKPVTREQLINCICNVGEVIKEERKKNNYIDEMYEKLKKSFPLLKEKYLADVVNGRIRSEQDILHKAEYFEIPFEGCEYIVLAMEIENFDTNKYSDGINEDYLIQFAVINIATEVLGETFLNRTFLDGSILYSILINSGHGFITNKLFEVLNELKEKLRQYIDVALTVGVGKRCVSVGRIYVSACEARDALKNKFLMGKEAIIFANNALLLEEKHGGYSREEEKRIIEEIKFGHDIDADILSSSMIDKIVESCGNDINQIYEYCFEFYIQLKRYLNYSDTSTLGMSCIRRIENCKTVDELKVWMSKIIENASKCITNQRLVKEYDVTKQAMDYILNNYSKDISLKSVASVVYMTPTYFSALFKKKSNENFQDYLTKVRMEAATVLLKDGMHKTFEVSYMVGYNNARYFSDVFKKYYGVTPSEYKEGKQSLHKRSYSVK